MAGVADELRHRGVAVFGPGRAAARIEGSKAFAKDVMRAAGVPTAATLAVARAPCVVKVDGLAAGKGVFVCRTGGGARGRPRGGVGLRRAARDRGAAGRAGGFAVRALRRRCRPWRSLLPRTSSARTTGTRARTRAAWGRMRRCPGWAPSRSRSCSTCVHRPVLEELARRGTPFVGLLFAGLMLTARRAAGARVQLPVRRSGDAVGAAARRWRPARGVRGRGARRSRRRRARDRPGGGRDGGRSGGGLSGGAATAAPRSTASRMPSARARSSSTRAPPCTTAACARTAAGS